MAEKIQNIEPGRPARPGQLILERRYRIVKELLPADPNISTLLDLGCGNGAQTAYLTEFAETIYALDLMHIDTTEQPEKGRGIGFIQGSAQELPFNNNSIDLVTSFEVLEHVQDDLEAVREVARILRPGGKFIFSVPNKGWILESHGAVVPGLNWLPWNRIPFVSWLPKSVHSKIARARIYTLTSAARLVERSGLEVISAGYITAPLDVLPEGRLRNILRSTLFASDRTDNKFVAVNLFIYCQKPG
ncbi:class I SAM-dependent methyltransferase [Calditrichota bacterium]